MVAEVHCHQGLVHVGAASSRGLQQVFFNQRCIGIVKEVNGRYAITVKQGKPRAGTYPLWLACGAILTSHLCLPQNDQEILID